MSKRTSMIDDTGEVRELTAADLHHFKPAEQALPPRLHVELRALNRRAGVRGAQKAPTKVLTTIRLSRDVMEAFRATGPGWQTRMDAALRDWLRTHTPRP